MISTLVTGGAGFVGSNIVRQLRLGIETVRVLSRNPKQMDPARRSPGAEYVQGDIFDDAALRAAMKDCDALVIASQFDNAPFEDPKRGLTYMRVDGEGTERQVAIAKEMGIKRIIYISGAGTREGRSEVWFQAKARAEKAVRESGANWTIFRPSWIYGPEDKSLNKFAMFARIGPMVPVIGTGKEKIQPVFVGDVAKAVAKSLNNAATYGQVFEIGGPEEMTMTQIVQTMLQVMEKKRLILPHPKPIMKFIAAFAKYAPGRPLTPDGIDFVTMEEKVNNEAILKILNMRLTPLNEGLREYLTPKNSSAAAALGRHAI